MLEAVEEVRLIAEEAGVSLAQFALAWVLRQSNGSSAIIGASRPEQVVENAAAAELTIDEDFFFRAEDIFEPVRYHDPEKLKTEDRRGRNRQ